MLQFALVFFQLNCFDARCFDTSLRDAGRLALNNNNNNKAAPSTSLLNQSRIFERSCAKCYKQTRAIQKWPIRNKQRDSNLAANWHFSWSLHYFALAYRFKFSAWPTKLAGVDWLHNEKRFARINSALKVKKLSHLFLSYNKPSYWAAI